MLCKFKSSSCADSQRNLVQHVHTAWRVIDCQSAPIADIICQLQANMSEWVGAHTRCTYSSVCILHRPNKFPVSLDFVHLADRQQM